MVNHIKLFPTPHYPPTASAKRLAFTTGAETEESYGKHIVKVMLKRECSN